MQEDILFGFPFLRSSFWNQCQNFDLSFETEKKLFQSMEQKILKIHCSSLKKSHQDKVQSEIKSYSHLLSKNELNPEEMQELEILKEKVSNLESMVTYQTDCQFYEDISMMIVTLTLHFEKNIFQNESKDRIRRFFQYMTALDFNLFKLNLEAKKSLSTTAARCREIGSKIWLKDKVIEGLKKQQAHICDLLNMITDSKERLNLAMTIMARPETPFLCYFESLESQGRRTNCPLK